MITPDVKRQRLLSEEQTEDIFKFEVNQEIEDARQIEYLKNCKDIEVKNDK